MALSVVKALNKNNKKLPFSKFVKGFMCVGLGLGVANCASKPQYASNKSSEIGAFTHAKYGKASERVVSDGDDVPKGGGRYQVGKPYSVAGKTYVPREMNGKYSAVGMASWYGAAFHGRKTANGEVYDKNSITAAHPTMPLPSYARVTNVNNGRSIIVRVNDRGPYHGGRVMDVSQKVAESLEFRHLGTAKLRIDHLGPAGLAGSDDRKLLASLTTGVPAQLEGVSQPQVQIASADSSYAPAFVTSAPAYKAPPIAASTRISTPAAMPRPEQQETENEDIATPTLAQAVPPSQSAGQMQASQMAQPVAPAAIPLPPQRPYDFGKIGAPIKVQNMVSSTQPQQAVLPRISGSTTASFYAAPDDLRTSFVKNDAFSGLKKDNIEQQKTSVNVAVGVFKNEANARKIIVGLGAGAKAGLVPFNNSYKVVAGPFASVENAKSVQSNAKALGAADAKIVAR